MTDIINTTPDGMVQVIFEIPYGDVSYRDALYLTADEYNSLTPTDIENMKNARFNEWISIITPVNS